MIERAVPTSEVDTYDPRIMRIDGAPDGLQARVTVDRLTKGHVHQFVLAGVRDERGQPLVHDVAYFTLNEIPGH